MRRRLFEPLIGTEAFKLRDVTARAFADLYRSQSGEFPPETKAGDYEKRLQAAYPIHPEIFDRLYNDWSTLVKFQRTRGVLRLMAAVIHSLWEKGDRNPLILPSMIPICFELTILFSALGCFLGMLGLNQLPRHHHPVFESDRFQAFSTDKFFISIEAADTQFDVGATRRFLEGLHPTYVELVEETT